MSHPFSVQASWGRLSGKAGDYVVKNFSDKDVVLADYLGLELMKRKAK